MAKPAITANQVTVARLLPMPLVAWLIYQGVGAERATWWTPALILASIAGLELAIREHFAGFRSHSTLLAGTVALIVLGVLFYAGPESLPPAARLGIGLAALAAAFYVLSAAFRRRAGVAFKLR